MLLLILVFNFLTHLPSYVISWHTKQYSMLPFKVSQIDQNSETSFVYYTCLQQYYFYKVKTLQVIAEIKKSTAESQ